VVEALGLVGIATSVAAYLPQLLHIAREHCSAGVSGRAWAMWFVSALLVGLVAVSRRDPIFMTFQLCSLVSAGAILFLIRKYRGMACGSHAGLAPEAPEVSGGTDDRGGLLDATSSN
jgi:hypothetical protein